MSSGSAANDRLIATIPDAYGIAVPYFVDQAVAGSVTATIPRHQRNQLNIDELTRQLTEATRTLTHLLSLQ